MTSMRKDSLRVRLSKDPLGQLFAESDGFSKYVILTELSGHPPDSPVAAALGQTLVRSIVKAQDPGGSWGQSVYRDFFNGTAKQLGRLGVLAAHGDDTTREAIDRAVAYIASHQAPGGAILEDAAAHAPGMCRHHFEGNLCVSLDCLEALKSVGVTDGPPTLGVARWIMGWQRPDGSWWSPGAAGREGRGTAGAPGCGYWLTMWALTALAGLPEEATRQSVRRGAEFLLSRYGEHPGRAWRQGSDEFMWCSVGARFPEERMEAIVTGAALRCLSLAGYGLRRREVSAGVQRLCSLQDPDGYWRVGHPRLDGWLTLNTLQTFARLDRMKGGD